MASLLIICQSLIDDIINSVNDLVYQGISSLENGLLSIPPEKLGFRPTGPYSAAGSASEDDPEYPEAKREIEEGLHKLETLLESTVDKNFDRFEIYLLRNILSVPEDLAGWITLSHYEVCSQTRWVPWYYLFLHLPSEVLLLQLST
jgi:kinetochore protein Mis12/MTW1